MPELPEVETVRRGLNAHTCQQRICGGTVLLNRSLASPAHANDFIEGMQGQSIRTWHRRGKYLIAQLGEDDSCDRLGPTADGWLGVHLRMTGQLLWCHPEDPLEKHTRVRLFFEGDRELRFVDIRTFGRLWWVPPHTSPHTVMTGLLSLGPEPFSPEFSSDYLISTLANRRKPIKTALLDQTIVAGVGNIYADESLFLSGIPPTRLCSQLTPDEIDRLRQQVIDVLSQAIEAGGTTLRDFRDVTGINGNYGGMAWVYNRNGQPCRQCGTPIARIKLGGRSSHFCPSCQPDPKTP
ncbi:DNA-formamidopyrimidine glycosylase [Phormidium yuhuli AB48]|uniref:Formamidopyrimidine-DNA glycosylase n=1 Tax=Phormidium yuhuli AB48 TaxID=2940671 RepID=A0ABY5AKK7_9CYAN|nr:DNA-formamidopyrimidine glycosylase [Phormidium yuhuli]USR89380.1 DNA-formamidopyrimidine glycosylase [Phormidium yuhuli AB48]